jgi:hypothetical protein
MQTWDTAYPFRGAVVSICGLTTAAQTASGEPDDHSTVTSPPLVDCSGLLGRSQEHGLALALTLDVPQPLPEPHDSYCVVISE